MRNSLSEELLNQKGDEYFIRESEGIPLLLFEMLRAAEENPIPILRTDWVDS
jgi:hypothetical protein